MSNFKTPLPISEEILKFSAYEYRLKLKAFLKCHPKIS